MKKKNRSGIMIIQLLSISPIIKGGRRDRMVVDLQVPMQSVPITTNVVSTNPTQAKCDKVCQ